MALISNGTTILDAGAVASGLGASLSVIKKLTASSSANLSFVQGSAGVDFQSHKEILFIFTNIHVSNDNTHFGFNASIDAGSNYNVAKTSGVIDCYHGEDGSGATVEFNGTASLAQATGIQRLTNDQGNANDENVSGYLHIYEASSSTFAKQFIASSSRMSHNDYAAHQMYGGYLNSASDVDAIQFSMSAGTIDSGTITMYGIA